MTAAVENPSAEPAASRESIDKSNARVQRMFGQIASRYDLLNHVLSLNVDRYWRWRTVRRVPPVGEGPILDVCTGTGDLAIAYAKAGVKAARRVGGGAKPPAVVGADFCREMLDVAERKRAKSTAADLLTFVEADAQKLPFDDGRFQIVSVAFGLRNVFDTDAGLREMVRVLRPGGRLAVLEFSMPTWGPFERLYRWYFRRVLPKVGERLARNDNEAYAYLPATVAEFPSGEALAARMQAAGLASVEFYPMTLGIATLYVGVK
ncbi:MAG: bifunctional demethylmenaquinone methyltransferase/2-methoxy-6-polyprenyl-1,4-benzoquinol methylase UbiE [Planctomycetota bacterium]|nr:MAG: bifunctional demethylmenaquinone methyltransferase/2-methoxy-6-polyprenyl-1,4-benzoquinol methylase UbiE [Planctomycetota bacterium]